MLTNFKRKAMPGACYNNIYINDENISIDNEEDEPTRGMSCQFQYNLLVSNCSQVYQSGRTYEYPFISLYLVVNELKTRKVKDKEERHAELAEVSSSAVCEEHETAGGIRKLEKHLRNKFKYERILITREILQRNIHYNILMTMHMNEYQKLLRHNIISKDYIKPYVTITWGIGDVYRLIRYIFKEAQVRQFYPKIDYYVYCK